MEKTSKNGTIKNSENKASILKTSGNILGVIGLAVLFIIIVGTILAFYALSPSTHEYNRFNDRRTAEMEEYFAIKVDENVELQYYREYSTLMHFNRTLQLEVKDYEDFIQKCVLNEVSDITVEGEEMHCSYTAHGADVDITVIPTDDGKYSITLYQWD